MAYANDPQPVLNVMRANRPPWSISALAYELGVGYGHFHAVVHGRARPSPQVIEQLPAILGVPLEELFEPSRLDKPWRGFGRNHYSIEHERKVAERKAARDKEAARRKAAERKAAR